MTQYDKNRNNGNARLRRFVHEAILDHIDPMVTMTESRLRSYITRAVNEGRVSKQLWEEATSDNKEKKSSSASEQEIAQKRKSVMNMLKNDALNHAELMRRIWHPKPEEEDSMRSLFSKMATGTPDADGVVREFSDDDILKLYQILRNINK